MHGELPQEVSYGRCYRPRTDSAGDDDRVHLRTCGPSSLHFGQRNLSDGEFPVSQGCEEVVGCRDHRGGHVRCGVLCFPLGLWHHSVFGLADEIEATTENLKANEGRKLAAKVLKTWIEDFVDEDTGEVIPVERTKAIVERGEILNEETIEKLTDTDVKTILLQKDEANVNEYAIIYNTLQKDPTNTEMEAVNYIYKQLRNSEPPDEATARDVIDKLFFSEKRYGY